MTEESPMLMSSIAPWFGSKRGMAPLIAEELGKHKSYWELCCGSMAVLLSKPRSSHEHVVDMHGDLLNLARVIQDPKLGPALYRRLRRVLSHEGIYDDAKGAVAEQLAGDSLFGEPRELPPLERAYWYFILSWMGRNGVAGTQRINYQPAARWTHGGGHSGLRFANAVKSIPAWRRRLRSVSILQKNIFDVISKIEDQSGTVIYIDPPYVRDDDTRSGGSKYEHEFNLSDHRLLAAKAQRFKKVRIVVSYYDTPLVRDLYPGWTFLDCTTSKNLHVQNRRGIGKVEAPEVLIINGKSYTEGATS